VRELYSAGFGVYGEMYEWFDSPYYTNTATDIEIIDGIYTQYMDISGYNPNGSYYLKASNSLDASTGLENVFIRGYDTWTNAAYGYTFLDRIYNASTTQVQEAYLYLRFNDESTNYVSDTHYQYWLDKVTVPYLYTTNWSKRYDALYRLGNYTKRHVQTWTTNATANQYQWSGAETTTYDLAIADCLAATPTTITNAGSPYRYTLVNKIMTFDSGSTTWQAYAYSRLCYPSVSGMATSLSKHVDFYIQTIPKTVFYSIDGYETNEYNRLPDESFDAGNLFTYISTQTVGSVDNL